MRMRHIVICGLSRSTIFFHIISKNGLIFKKKMLVNTKGVFLFALQRSYETFFILRRI